jgi:hypothetical protein
MQLEHSIEKLIKLSFYFGTSYICESEDWRYSFAAYKIKQTKLFGIMHGANKKQQDCFEKVF